MKAIIFFLVGSLCLISVQALKGKCNSKKPFDWKSYPSLEEINTFLDDTLKKYPDVTENIEIGKSYEGRPIRGIKISYKSGNPGVYVESGSHAREWIAPATATWFINELLSSKDPAVRKLAEDQDWYIIPLLNVDGYKYSQTTNRLWTKNRQPIPNSNCIGTDLNRNFDSHWAEVKEDNSDPCGLHFPGTAPNSAPEVKAETDYINSIKDKLNVFLSFHSYMQVLLAPYDYTYKAPPNYKDLKSVGDAYVNAVKALEWQTQYKADQASKLTHRVSGEANNWVYEKAGIPISYVIDMRDLGTYGYKLPADQIIPNAKETLAGITALVNQSRNLNYMNKKY